MMNSKDSNKWSVAVVQLDVLGVSSWHAKCLDCKWEGKSRTREAGAVKDAKHHGAAHAKDRRDVVRKGKR